ncbi:hypothetical protein AAC387_Pa08g2460 [Persea americana]
MGVSLKKGYQEEALMEGKRITTSIEHLAIDLRELKRWRSNEQEEESRAGLGFLVLKELQEEEKKKTPPYIDNGYGSHNLKVQSS